jgi:hypothetical protein
MTLRTRISLEECKARLVSAVDAERFGLSFSGYGGSKPILGKIGDNSFRLQKRRYYRNSFAPFFFGRFVPSDTGTVIEGEFRMHPFINGFMIFWFSFLAFLFVTMLASSITGQGFVEGSRFLVPVIPVGLALFGIVFLKVGRWLGKGEEKDIIAFLKSTLEANDAT